MADVDTGRVDAGYQAFEMTFRTDAAVNDTGFYATYTITPTWEQRRPTPVIDKATYDEQRQSKGEHSAMQSQKAVSAYFTSKRFADQ